MQKMAFSIYDKKALDFGFPFAASTDHEALRMVLGTLLKGNTSLSQFPEDFELYHVGGFATDTGVFLPLERPQIVMRVDNILAAYNSSKEVQNG